MKKYKTKRAQDAALKLAEATEKKNDAINRSASIEEILQDAYKRVEDAKIDLKGSLMDVRRATKELAIAEQEMNHARRTEVLVTSGAAVNTAAVLDGAL